MTRLHIARLTRLNWFPAVAIAIASLTSVAQSPPENPATIPPKQSNSSTAPAEIALPLVGESKPRDYHGLHNVVAFHDGYLSGSVPEGDAGFDALLALGVKTIISVDGAEPDVEKARARGIRYIHLPIGYNGFDEKRKLQLVRATRDAMNDGPVYTHCHHGKHRSAGAAGTVAASLGWLTPEQAVERMKVSGAAPNYKGLYACTAGATVLDARLIDAVPADFPEVSKPESFVKSMVEIELINDRLKLIEKAGWNVPADHPDLVPAAEAGRMADLFRLVVQSEESNVHPEDFATSLRLDSDRLTELEAMIVAGEKDLNKMSACFKLVQTSCKDCHAKYRD